MIVISSGHGQLVRGAEGPIPWGLDEVNEARRTVERVADYLRAAGIAVTTYHDNVSTTQDENLQRIVDFHNSQTRDLDMSVHFNAYEITEQPRGTECLYVTQQDLASVVSSEIALASGLIDRGPKYRDDLFWLNNTEAPAVLVEICFVDSSADVSLYTLHFEAICRALATAIGGGMPSRERPRVAELTPQQRSDIIDIASDSPIAGYDWADRGYAPIGWTQGMALAFAQSCLKLMARHPAVIEIAKARTDSDKDALNIYRDEFEELGLYNEDGGTDTLRHLYALMLGHGMRESSGQHCCGRDQSASNTDSDTCEAGAFQTSYNAHSASEPWFDDLMDEFTRGEAPGFLDAFAEDVTCSESDWQCYGGGRGFEFQNLCKNFPAFAAESAALTLRNLANHYGPVVRKEVELRLAADEMFLQVQNYLVSGSMIA